MAIGLRQLEAFRAVARYGSMTAAARAMRISQPAVSRLLASFRDYVGFPLFERRDGGLTPTQEARYLMGEVERALDSLGRIEDLTRNLMARKAGHLRIACLPGFATSHLPTVLARFLEARPGVTATVEPDRPERILDWLIGQQYDFGITDSFVAHPAVENEMVPMRTVCILPPGHPLGAKAVIEPDDLATERMIHSRRDSDFYKAMETTFGARGLTIPSRIEIRQFTGACMLVAEGAGVSVVSEMDAMEHAHRGYLIRPFQPTVAHHLSLVRPTHASPSILTSEFMDAFLKSLAPYRIDAT